jgi:transposase
MTDAEWAVIEPLLPAPGSTTRQGGCPGSYCRRDIIDGIRYLVHNGCVWRALPADLPHWRTAYGYVRTWQADGATRGMHDTLREQVRVLAGRGPHPTAAIIDSQSIKAADLHLERHGGRCWVMVGSAVLAEFAESDTVMRNFAVTTVRRAGFAGKRVAEVFGLSAAYVSTLQRRRCGRARRRW